jgi:subtilisin family serine protease
MDVNRNLSTFNTRNDAVAIFAPGQNIKVPGSSRLSGTSFAVPFASALAALELGRLRTVDPLAKLSRPQAINFLRETLGLSCDVHTYSTDICGSKGSSFETLDQQPNWIWYVFLICMTLFFIFEKR